MAFVSRLCCHRQDQDQDDGAAKLLVCARIPRTVLLEKTKAGSYQTVMCCGSSKFSHFKQKLDFNIFFSLKFELAYSVGGVKRTILYFLET